jgi:hypothetical protein
VKRLWGSVSAHERGRTRAATSTRADVGLEPADEAGGLGCGLLAAVERHRQGDDGVDGPVGAIEPPAAKAATITR